MEVLPRRVERGLILLARGQVRVAGSVDELVSGHWIVVAGPDLANLRNAKNLVDLLRTARPNKLKNETDVWSRSESCSFIWRARASVIFTAASST